MSTNFLYIDSLESAIRKTKRAQTASQISSSDHDLPSKRPRPSAAIYSTAIHEKRSKPRPEIAKDTAFHLPKLPIEVLPEVNLTTIYFS